MIYDIIIIGMGPAGMSAGIYAKRSGMSVLVFEKSAPGGLINKTSNVDNYLGFDDILGPDLAFKMYEHFKDADIEHKITEVTKVTLDGDIKLVHTEKEVYKAHTVLIATGRKSKKLPLENAEKLEGKGISYCALCDGKLYQGKDVAIVGAGNSAFEEGTYLAKICKNVYILNRFGINADDILVEEINTYPNVKLLNQVSITKLNETEGHLSSVTLNTGEEIEVDGVFVYIGYEQASESVKELGITNDFGYIKVDQFHETSIKGIYAAGDIVQKKIYQIINAASEGAEAAINANKYINSLRVKK
ncbi:MAG: NAD(P)/FAD-dependent oxidoreductase [Mollicutes bacterium]|nr:NAD(P)/FAD-dependent oxidoreductase [Mollicutes bacterium]